MEERTCRPGCGACCIAPSISSALPDMPGGKAAGVVCIHLDAECLCGIYGRPERPSVCAGIRPCAEMCGDSREHALAYLARLEELTKPTGACGEKGVGSP